MDGGQSRQEQFAVMRRALFLFAVFLPCFYPLRASAIPLSLLPIPQRVNIQPGSLPLDGGIQIDVEPPHGHAYSAGDKARIVHAIDRFSKALQEPAAVRVCEAPCSAATKLSVAWQVSDTADIDADESYHLEVTPQGAALRAHTIIGVLRGFATLTQLVEPAVGQLPAVDIEDKPRFPWRGLMLDTARQYVPIDIIERNLDAMAAVKMNVLHWHLTDDQGFRVESRTYPALHQMGADGSYYRQTEIKRVVFYAQRLGIRVVPEFDVPGHTSSWLVSHPELASGPAPQSVPQHWGIFDDALDPTQEATFVLLDHFLAEMTSLFPDPYVHVGGDEVTGEHWRRNDQIQQFMRRHNLANEHALHTYFINRVALLAQKHGKRIVGWDEVLQDGLASGTVVQSWQGHEGLAAALSAGYNAILSSGYYLDGSVDAAGYYLNDPEENLTPEQLASGHLLGGEACQWGELIGPHNYEGNVWPRAAAIAERLWSARTVVDTDDMYRRLAIQSERFAQIGLEHIGFGDTLVARNADPSYFPLITRLIAFVEPWRANWWDAFHWRRPLDRLSDALYPESQPGRELRAAVRDWLATRQRGPAPASIAGPLQTFAHIHDEFVQLDAQANGARQDTPLLADARTTADALQATAQLGNEALRLLAAGEHTDAAWKRHAESVLASGSNMNVGFRLALTAPVADLVAAVPVR